MDDFEAMFTAEVQEAMVQGFTARLQEHSPSSNPFDFGTEDFDNWIDAFFMAHALLASGVCKFVNLEQSEGENNEHV